MPSLPTNSASESLQLVFVYGTLKRGHEFNYALTGQTYLGPATTSADYRMYSLGDYPGLVEVELGTGDQIQGEIYQVDSACLRQLDQIEAVDQGLYERREIRFDDPLIPADLPPKTLTALVAAYFYLGDVDSCNSCGACW